MELSSLRAKRDKWSLLLIAGPNMTNLGRMDRRLYGSIPSLEALHAGVTDVANGLGMNLTTVASNIEGEILEWIHENGPIADGILINLPD